MSEAKLDITGSGAVAERELQKVTKQLAKVREENRRLNQEAKKGNEDVSKSMSGTATVASGLVTRFLSVGAAVGILTRGYSEWRSHTDELIDAHDRLSMSFTRVLAESGKLRLAPQAEKFIKGVKGATPEQATAALAGVLQSGETLSDKRTFGVAGEIAKLAPTQIDLTQAGKLAADIADIAGQGVSDEDVADLTVGLKQQLREKTEMFSGPKFQRQMEHLKRGGMTGEDALAHAVAALQSEQGAEAVKVLATKGSERTPDQRRMLKDVFAPEKISGIKQKLEGYKRDNLAAQELEALQTSRLTTAQTQQQTIEESKGKNALAAAAYAEARRARKFAREEAYGQGVPEYMSQLGRQAVNYSLDIFRTPDAKSELAGSTFDTGSFTKTLNGKEGTQAILTELKNQSAIMRGEARSRVNVDAHVE